jgi:SWI/SNF-related matrix-associated actin-dependent regulator of chromatin subfamily A member 5
MTFNVTVLTVSKEERAETIATGLLHQDSEVCITSYGTFSSPIHTAPTLTICIEICFIERSALKRFSFEYNVIDEAHHTKNVD